jgi:hypothetical protein
MRTTTTPRFVAYATAIAAALVALTSSAACGTSGGGSCCAIPLSLSMPCSPCGGGASAAPASTTAPAPPPPPPPASTTANEADLRRRASFELDCPASTLELIVLDARSRGVRGCGKKATYVERCEAAGSATRCDWVPAPAPAPTSPPPS